VSTTVIIAHWHIQGAQATRCAKNTNIVSNLIFPVLFLFLTCPVCFLKTVLKNSTYNIQIMQICYAKSVVDIVKLMLHSIRRMCRMQLSVTLFFYFSYSCLL